MAASFCCKFQFSSCKTTFSRRFSSLKKQDISQRFFKRYSSSDENVFIASKVLYLNSSGLDNKSFTGKTAREFLDKYTELNPDHLVEEINLWDAKLLNFSLSHVQSKMRLASGQDTVDDHLRLLAVKEMTSQLFSASKVVISCPMWNYSVPYVLKQYIDCVVQSDWTFCETENGPEGLVTGRPLLLITSSSSDFSNEPLKSLDFQVPYLKAIFGLIGFEDFRHIYIGNTKHISRKILMENARLRISKEVQRF